MNAEIPASPYNVNIVGPIEDKKLPPATKKTFQKPPAYTGKSVPRKMLDRTPPKTLFGEGTDSLLRQLKNEKNKLPSHPPLTKEGQKGVEEGAGNPGGTLSDKKGILPEGKNGLSQKPKSFLFDKETIEKYAHKNKEEGEYEKKELTFDAPELKHRGYMRKLKEKIESLWKYPEEAARRGLAGDLYIKFSIHKNGNLGEIELVRTSGYSDLDKAAIKALKDAAPYWPLPDDVEEEELSITGHFIYIYGTPIIM